MLKASNKIKKDLDSEQLQAVEAKLGNVVVNALAGSGKTRVLTYRVANLIDNGINPSEIVLLTFTNKAAEEMTDRIEKLVGSGSKEIVSGTFHSVAIRMMRTYFKNFNLHPMDEDSKKENINYIRRMLCKEKGYKLSDFTPTSRIISVFSKSINHNKTIEEVIKTEYSNDLAYLEDILKIRSSYQKTKIEQSLMDFDDMLLIFMKALEKQEFLNIIQNKHKYFFVDEYQDVNWIQHKILKLLSNKDKNLFVIGDPYQCIYQFRGSNEDYIKNFNKDYPDAQSFSISTNYRSKENILKAAEGAIQKNSDNEEIKFNVFNKGGQTVTVHEFYDPYEQASGILKIIKEKVKPENYNQATILVRTKHEMSLFESEAKMLDLPIKLWGYRSLFERKHIKDVIAFIRVIHNPKDRASFIHYAKLFPKIGEITATKLYEEYKEAEGDFTKVNMNHDVFKVLQYGSYPDTISEQIEAFVNKFYQEYLELTSDKETNALARLSDVEVLKHLSESLNGIDEFLERIVLEENLVELKRKGKSEDSEPKINVMTMHKSKGLEWDYVFLPNLNQGVFPRDDLNNMNYFVNSKSVQNERNLFYVAITRAVKACYITYPANSARYDKLQPSPFLKEIKDYVVEHEVAELKKEKEKKKKAASKGFATLESLGL